MTVVDAVNAADGFTGTSPHRVTIIRIDGTKLAIEWNEKHPSIKAALLFKGDNVVVSRRIF